jgi:cytosine deaminase
LSILVRNAITLSKSKPTCILIEGGKIAKIAPDFPVSADRELDAKGSLVLPTFIEPHIHLDKVLLSKEYGYSASIADARTKIREAKEGFNVNKIRERIEEVIPRAIQHGVTIIRTHIDVDPVVELKGLRALEAIRREYSNRVDFQIVAHPQEGILKQKGTDELLIKAIESGADLIGGLPEAEATAKESKLHLDRVFSIAREKNVDVDVHNDVMSRGRNLEYFISRVTSLKYQGRASSAHNIALAHYQDDYARKIIDLTKKARINIVTNPCTMMTSGGQDPPPISRGITRVKELVRAGVNVTFGIDNMVDPFNPFGDFDPLRNGWLLAYAGQLNSPDLFETIPMMITYNAAVMLRLSSYGLREGCKADLNVMKNSRIDDALRFGDIPRYVIKSGNIVAENELKSVITG